MTEYSRVSYQMDGRAHTVWAERDRVETTDAGGLIVENIETGTMKLISCSTPFVLTEGVELPAGVKENAETVKA